MSRHFLIPNSTQIPDVYLDVWMAKLTAIQFKVLMYICRRTYGFRKESDTISVSQIAHGITKQDGTVLDLGTGLGETGIKSALVELERYGLIEKRINKRADGSFLPCTYTVLIPDIEEGVGRHATGTPLTLWGGGGSPRDGGVGRHATIQHTVLQNTDVNTPLPPLGESNPILSESQLADTDSFSGVYVRPSKPERLSKGLSTVSDLTPLYLAYRLGLNGTPLDSPVTPSQVKRNAKALQEMLDAGYTQEQISTTTAKIKAAWGEGFTVTPASVVEHWDKHCSPPPSKATISPRCAAPPSSSVSADTLRALDIEDEETARFYLLRARRRLEEEGTITTFDAKVHKQLVVERAKQMIDKEYRK